MSAIGLRSVLSATMMSRSSAMFTCTPKRPLMTITCCRTLELEQVDHRIRSCQATSPVLKHALHRITCCGSSARNPDSFGGEIWCFRFLQSEVVKSKETMVLIHQLLLRRTNPPKLVEPVLLKLTASAACRLLATRSVLEACCRSNLFDFGSHFDNLINQPATLVTRLSTNRWAEWTKSILWFQTAAAKVTRGRGARIQKCLGRIICQNVIDRVS